MFLPFCHNARVRQTDRRTDNILIVRPRLHSMQRGKKKQSGMHVCVIGDLVHFPRPVINGLNHVVYSSELIERLHQIPVAKLSALPMNVLHFRYVLFAERSR